MPNARELIDMLIEKAPKLREAGVSRVDLEDVYFELRPVDLEPDAPPIEEPAPKKRGPMDDPDTYGGRNPQNLRR